MQAVHAVTDAVKASLTLHFDVFTLSREDRCRHGVAGGLPFYIAPDTRWAKSLVTILLARRFAPLISSSSWGDLFPIQYDDIYTSKRSSLHLSCTPGAHTALSGIGSLSFVDLSIG